LLLSNACGVMQLSRRPRKIKKVGRDGKQCVMRHNSRAVATGIPSARFSTARRQGWIVVAGEEYEPPKSLCVADMTSMREEAFGSIDSIRTSITIWDCEVEKYQLTSLLLPVEVGVQ
jgi:hypothetical protein